MCGLSDAEGGVPVPKVVLSISEVRDLVNALDYALEDLRFVPVGEDRAVADTKRRNWIAIQTRLLEVLNR
jgi:hypothetical protein